MSNLDSILKSRDITCQQKSSSQGYDFSSSHVWMWELDCEESWVLKNWCFCTAVLEKTLEALGLQGDPTSPSKRRSVLVVHWKDWCWSWNSNTLATWWKNWLIGKDSDAGRNWGQEEKGTTEDEMAGWHHRLDGHESEWTLRVGDGLGGLACCNSRGRKELDTTEQLNWMHMHTSMFEHCGRDC